MSYWHYFVLYASISTAGNMFNYYRMGRSRISSYLLISFGQQEQQQIGSIESNILNRIGDIFLCLPSIVWVILNHLILDNIFIIPEF